MKNPETYTTLGTRHRTKTTKTKQNHNAENYEKRTTLTPPQNRG